MNLRPRKKFKRAKRVKEKPCHRNVKKRSRLVLMSRFAWMTLGDAAKPIKKVESDPIDIDPDQIQIWMIGHATLLINLMGTTILTDPVFVNWLPFPRRQVKPGFSIDDLPNIDIVAVSHAHWDHFNKRSLKKIANKADKLVIAKNCSDLVKKIPFNDVVELDWETSRQVGEVTIHTYKPAHWGRRMPWEKFLRGYNSYVFEKNGKSVFFCGDSAYCEMFERIGCRHDIDVALLPIGAYNPPSFRCVHMDPEDALQAFEDLEAKHMIPMHWGNFRLSKEPMKEPREVLQELVTERLEKGVEILENGAGFEVPAR